MVFHMDRFLSCLFLLIFSISIMPALGSVDSNPYVIHMNKSAMPSIFSDHHQWYLSTLSALSTSDDEQYLPTHLYTYTHVLDGFSAMLSRSQLHRLEKMPGHIASYPDVPGKLLTTRTPKFLGLEKDAGLWPRANFGDDVIIGLFDSGIWPESKSFRDDGLSPVPTRWRGACEISARFNSSSCNRKLIGARTFINAWKEVAMSRSTCAAEDVDESPRDHDGHGTHVSSIAAGSPVEDASFFKFAKGRATGMAPKARIAMYKLFQSSESNGFTTSDSLAGMDQAIADGVDIMSFSLGFEEPSFDVNPIAVGAFAAMEKGIFVTCAAGNNGSEGYFTVSNGAPWITTVGAGTIDRDHAADVTLGDNQIAVRGKSLYNDVQKLFVSGVPIYFKHGNRSQEMCEENSLDPKIVGGKYVFCDTVNESLNTSGIAKEIHRAGAAGAIISTASSLLFFRPELKDTVLQLVAVNQKDGDLIKDYLIKVKNATVGVRFQLTALGTEPAPVVDHYSSRGPYRFSPWILKPDILAPGSDILAAWTRSKCAPIGDGCLLTDFKLEEGTSMATPHIAGVAALLKSVHKHWSPAAIRSAMMTTAYVIDNANGTIIDMATRVAGTPLDYGAGLINPGKAVDPGLVYDIKAEDYINYLCGMNYTSKQIKVITGQSDFSCDQASLDLNYPSFIVLLNNTDTATYTFKRVLTNVVNSSAVYQAMVKAPLGMNVVVEPTTVAFAGKDSRSNFSMKVEVKARDDVRAQSDPIVSYGYLSWNEVKGKHVVRSPIVAAYAPH